MKRTATVAFVLALALTILSCGGKQNESQGSSSAPGGASGGAAGQPGGKDGAVKELRVGEFASMTGATATFGISMDHGILMAVDEANVAGGVAGVPIRVISEDDQGKPEEAATAANKLISQDQVAAVLGEVASSNSLAAAPICQQAQVPMITPASTNEKVTETGDYIFRVCFIDPFQGAVMAKFARQSLGLSRVAILRDVRSDYSLGLASAFRKTFEEAGGTIVADESFQQGDVDFRAPLTAIGAAKPDGIFVPGYYTDVGLIVRQARDLGIKVPMMGGDGWDSPKVLEIGKEAIEGCYFSNHYANDDESPVVQEFIGKYEQRYGAKPDAMAALGYDAARLLFDALQRVEQNSPGTVATLADGHSAGKKKLRDARAALRDEIAATKGFPGVTGSITIDPQRNARKSAVVLQIRDGGFHFVERVEP
ncbi:MAG: ABC transporter substrate-binding protein [Candidatus Eisenbacteria bacterium]